MRNSNSPPGLDHLIGIKEVTAQVGISKASVYRMMKARRFPAAKELMPGGRRVAWLQSDVTAWAAEPMAWGCEADF